MSLDLAIVGLGLVSPVAVTAREHAFLIRAEAAMHAPRAFRDATGAPLEVLHCPVVDPALPFAERLVALGDLALDDALADLDAWAPRHRVEAHLCAPFPSPHVGPELLDACEQHWAAQHQLRFGRREAGAAGAFALLAGATEAMGRGASAVVVLAIDSFADPALIAALPTPSRWESAPPRHSEAAAAIVVTTAALASEVAPRFGRLRFAGVARGVGSDLDDEPPDGRAMTSLLQQASAEATPWSNVFGPFSVDDLRRASFQAGMVRQRHAFALDGDQRCVEHAIGRVGAASGLAHLVYAAAQRHHGLLAHDGGTLAWTLSSDGTRGVAVVAP